MTLTVGTTDTITSDATGASAWLCPRLGVWFTSFSGVCFFSNQEEAETVMRYAEFIDGRSYVGNSEAENEKLAEEWSSALGLDPECFLTDMRRQRLSYWSD